MRALGLLADLFRAAGRPFGMLTWVLALVALAIWLIGPLIAVEDFRPLASPVLRVAIVLALLALWAVVMLVRRARGKAGDRTLADAALREQEEKQAAARRVQVTAQARLALFGESARGALRLASGAGRWRRFRAGRALPRYLVIGAGGSGKSALLLNMGLSVQGDSLRDADDEEAAQFLVAEQGLFIEIAAWGLRQAQEHERLVWLGMLDFIRRRRPTQPLNGVLLTVDAGELLAMPPDRVESFSSVLRRRLDEIDKRLRTRPPVYLVLTKLDLLVGFEPFLESLSAAEKDEAFGLPLWSPGIAATPQQRLAAGFDAIMERLKARQMRRLQEEADERLRPRIHEFPAQFALLQTQLATLVGTLSAQSRFGAAPLLRGAFFTSALQTGLRRDVLPTALADGFAMRPAALAGKRMAGALHARPLFLRGLLDRVILTESGMAGRSRGAAAVQAVRGLALNIAAGIAIFAAALLLWFGYSEGRAYTARLADAVANAESRLAMLTDGGGSAPAFPATLRALDALAGLAQEAPARATLGLYSPAPARKAGEAAYRRGLETLLQPYVAGYLEAGLDAETLDAATRFDLLKLYLMLGGVRPLEPEAARLAAPAFAAALLPGADPQESRARLAAHLGALAAIDLPEQPLNAALVDRARARIADTGLAKLAYDKLAEGAAAQALPVWRPVDNMGTQGPQVLARVSGASLWDGIAGLHTRQGYRSVVLPQAGRIAEAMASELWVMGQEPEGTGIDQIETARQTARIRDGMLDLYGVATIRRWDSLLADLAAAPVASAGEAAALVTTLTGAPSPIAELLAAIAIETDFRRDDPATGALLAKSGLADAETLAAAAPRRVVDAGRSISDHYARLAAATGAGKRAGGQAGEKGEQPAGQSRVDALLAAFQPLYGQLNLVASGGDILSLGTKPQDTLADIDRMIQELPEALHPFFRRLVVELAGVAGVSSRDRLADIWDTTVLPQCRMVVTGHYPFDPRSKADAPLADFAAVFGPQGAIAVFRDGYLKPFIDTSARPWRWRGPQDGASRQVGLGLGDEVLAAFERADAISKAYFAESGAPGVTLQITPLGLDGAASAFQFDSGGPVYTYAHGPAVPGAVTWPPQQAGAPAGLSVTPEVAGERSIILRQGPWALFRLLQAGRRINADRTGPGVTDLAFAVGRRAVRLEFTAPAFADPVSGGLLAGFACPHLGARQSADL